MNDTIMQLIQSGVSAQRSRRLTEALGLYDEAIALGPVPAGVWVNISTILRQKGRPRAAAGAASRAAELAPEDARCHEALALALMKAGQVEEAVARWQRVLELRGSGDLPGRRGLASALRIAGRPEEALKSIELALEAAPEDAQLRFERALLLLMVGRYAEGWPAYEARWDVFPQSLRRTELPRWDGTPFPDQTLLLTTEQGFGDSLQFARFIPFAKSLGGTVLLECKTPLARLLRDAPGVDDVLVQTTSRRPLQERIDFACPLGSLPGLAGSTLEALPGPVPYLTIPPAEPERFEALLGRAEGRLKVGVAWAGSPSQANDKNRSMPFTSMLRLMQVPGVQLISVQVGQRAEDLGSIGTRSLILDAAPLLRDFADTAALLGQLDLLVSVDTAPAHLAGALGLPVWVLLSHEHDWRYLNGWDSCPWYPSMRLFCQHEAGEWAPVVADAAAALEELAAQRRA